MLEPAMRAISVFARMAGSNKICMKVVEKG